MELLVCVAIGSVACAAWGQDTRVVKEPVIPAACVKLEAKIAAVGETLKDADEALADTARIQEGIDSVVAKCGAGKAVELAAGKGTNAFLSGPLELREGVTLLVDKGVTLFASRRRLTMTWLPRPEQAVVSGGPGTCGTMPSKGAMQVVHHGSREAYGDHGGGYDRWPGRGEAAGPGLLVVGAGGQGRAGECAL